MSFVMNYYFKVVVIVIVFISIVIPTSYAQDSTDRALIASHPLISTRVKNIVENSNEKLWNKRNILYVQNNITLLQQDLTKDYKWEMIITDNPQNNQESISQAMDVLARYLCLHRQTILDSFQDKKYYKPSFDGDTVEVTQGACYRNNTLLRQEGIRYYTLPGKGTLQTIPLSLLKDLGYSIQNLENYIDSDDITLISSDSFFFEGFANKDIIPLLNLTHTEGAKKWKRRFDAVKIVAYVESNNYPFVDGNVMIAIFAKKGDNLIKITTPYGQLQHELLQNIMTMTQGMFVYSVQEDIKDSIILSKYYDTIYATIAKDNNISQSTVIKNLVHYYLSALWQYDEQPAEFAKMLPWLLEKDLAFQMKLQSALADLEAFL